MTWLFLAMIPPFLWAVETLIDQYMARKYFPGESILALTTGSILYALILPILGMVFHEHIMVKPIEAFLLIGLGVLTILSFMPYIKAIEKEDSSMAVPLYELSPAFVFFLGWVFFDERISQAQYGGVLLTLLGAVLVSFDFKTKRLRMNTVILMLLATFLWAVVTILKRASLFEVDWFAASYWMAYGYFFIFASLMIFSKKKRAFMIDLAQREKWAPFAWSFAEEVMFFSSMLIYMKALSLVPATGLLNTVMAIKPVFVLMLTYLAFKYKPKRFDPPAMGKEFLWRLFCILLILSGISVIYLSGASL